MDWLEELADEASDRSADVGSKLDEIVAALHDDSSVRRNHAALALSGASEDAPVEIVDAVGDIVDRLDEEPNDTVRYNLGLSLFRLAEGFPDRVGDYVSTLLERLNADADGDTKRVVAGTLKPVARECPKLFIDQSLEGLASGLESKEWGTRYYSTATLALVADVDPDAVMEFRSLLVDRLSADDAKMRRTVARALAALVCERPGKVGVNPEVIREVTDLSGEKLLSHVESLAELVDASPEAGRSVARAALIELVSSHRDRLESAAPDFLDRVYHTDGEVTHKTLTNSVDETDFACTHLHAVSGFVWSCPHAVDAEGDCLFHRPVEETDDQTVTETFLDAVNAPGAKRKEFYGATFGRMNLDKGSIDADDKHPVVLVDAKFRGSLNWEDVTVGQPLRCSGAEFFDTVNMREVTFVNRALFGHATFQDDLDMAMTTFSHETRFRETTFCSEANFIKTNFQSAPSFERAIFEGDARFGFVEIEAIGEINFEDVTIDGDAGFLKSYFGTQTNFSAAEIRGDTDFSRATFADSITFEQTTFAGDAKFSHITVQQWFHFQDTAVKGAATFENGSFGGNVMLINATLEGEVDFSKAQVDTYIALNDTNIKGNIKLRQMEVQGSIRAHESEFGGEVSLVSTNCQMVLAESATVRGELNLNRLTATQAAVLPSLSVDGDVSAEGTRFETRLELDNASFAGEVVFDGVTFDGKLQAKNATFEDGVRFNEVRFVRTVIFSGGRFAGQVDFDSTVFESTAHFEECRFAADAYFRDATFGDDAQFGGAEFEAAAFFEAADIADEGDFSRTTLSEGRFVDLNCSGSLNFDSVSCERLLTFEGADIQEGRFVNIDFRSEPIPIRFVDATLSGGVVRVDEPAVVYNFTEATVGDVEFKGGEDLIDHLRFVNTAFEGFDFSEIRDQLVAAGWRIHETLSDQSTDNDKDSPYPPNGWADLTSARLESTYLKAKNGANDVGDNDAAAEFFLLEMRYRREKYIRLFHREGSVPPKLGAAWRWLTNSALDISCGYGERPSRTIILSFSTILAYAALYWLFDFELPYAGLIGYLTFSVESFVSVVLGTPQTTDVLSSFLVASEGFVGGFIIALFVLTLTRSINR